MRVCLALLSLLLLAGCGASDGRLAVSGKVTLDGEPLSGAIVFRPEGAGLSTGGRIKAGAYRIQSDQGPLPGRYSVEIVSYQPAGEMIDDADRPGERVEKLDQVVPGRYNTLTELRVAIDGTNAKQLDFALWSQP